MEMRKVKDLCRLSTSQETSALECGGHVPTFLPNTNVDRWLFVGKSASCSAEIGSAKFKDRRLCYFSCKHVKCLESTLHDQTRPSRFVPRTYIPFPSGKAESGLLVEVCRTALTRRGWSPGRISSPPWRRTWRPKPCTPVHHTLMPTGRANKTPPGDKSSVETDRCKSTAVPQLARTFSHGGQRDRQVQCPSWWSGFVQAASAHSTLSQRGNARTS